MADANDVLAALCRTDGALDVPSIMAAINLNGLDRRRRKKVVGNLGILIARGLVARVEPDCTGMAFGDRPAPVRYRATHEGRSFVRVGSRITSGPKNAHSGPPARRPQTVRERAWAAFRLTQGRRATLPELVEIIRRADDPEPEAMIGNLRHYFGALCRAGIVTKLRARAEGFAPTSNGFVRFAMLRDPGPLAPRPARDGVFDPNSSQTIACTQAAPEPSRKGARA